MVGTTPSHMTRSWSAPFAEHARPSCRRAARPRLGSDVRHCASQREAIPDGQRPQEEVWQYLMIFSVWLKRTAPCRAARNPKDAPSQTGCCHRGRSPRATEGRAPRSRIPALDDPLWTIRSRSNAHPAAQTGSSAPMTGTSLHPEDGGTAVPTTTQPGRRPTSIGGSEGWLLPNRRQPTGPAIMGRFWGRLRWKKKTRASLGNWASPSLLVIWSQTLLLPHPALCASPPRRLHVSSLQVSPRVPLARQTARDPQTHGSPSVAQLTSRAAAYPSVVRRQPPASSNATPHPLVFPSHRLPEGPPRARLRPSGGFETRRPPSLGGTMILWAASEPASRSVASCERAASQRPPARRALRVPSSERARIASRSSRPVPF